MDSNFLIKQGFQKFGEFNCEDVKSRASELNFTGIYVFVLSKRFERLIGKTDILYIGRFGGVTGRRPIFKSIKDYCDAYKSAPQDKRISDSINKIKTKVRIGRTLNSNVLKNRAFIFYREILPRNCRLVEKELLNRYYEDHIELPPLNRSQ